MNKASPRKLFFMFAAIAITLFYLLGIRYVQHRPLAPLGSPKLTWNLLDQTQWLGPYQFEFKQWSKSFSVTNSDITLLSSLPDSFFIGASTGRQLVSETRGSFHFDYKDVRNCDEQIVNKVLSTSDRISISGDLLCAGKKRPWSINFELDGEALKFTSQVDPHLTRSYLNFENSSGQYFYGGGEQFTHPYLNYKVFPMWISEQGIGRSNDILTTLVELFARSGGTPTTTYAASSTFISPRGRRAFYIKNSEYGEANFKDSMKIHFEYWSPKIEGVVVTGLTPKELVTAITRYTGRMRALPDWVHKGAVLGLQGGTEKVRKVVAEFEKLDTPIAALWLQDWVGQRKTSFGKQLWWNWELNREHYTEWEDFTSQMKQKDIALMGYINPFLAELPDKFPHKRRLRDEAIDKNLLVRDLNDNILDIVNTSFSASLLDLTNPEAEVFVKDVIKNQLIHHGFKGWMADFGEALPVDVKLHSGDPRSYHNRYAEEWARINREAIDSETDANEYVFFTRAGFTHSPKYSTLFWAGDQNVTWDEFDGISTALTALLTSGVSGYAFNHSDIGGYTSIKEGPLVIERSEELLIRWMELNAFTSIFRSHEGNRPDDNLQVYSNEKLRRYFDQYAKLFARLFPYRKHLIQEAAEMGWPIVRPMYFEFPEDDASSYHDQFMLGSEILVAPVLNAGQTKRPVIFPEGRWRHIFTGELFAVSTPGTGHNIVDVPLGQPAVFIRDHSPWAKKLGLPMTESK